MLDPQDRQLLSEAFRPPDGYSLDFAVGTTYSLDLLSFLTIPLAFSAFALKAEEESGDSQAVHPALLEAVSAHADRIRLFCQAGQIRVPRRYRSLLTFLEEAVIEVQAPSPQHVFHPKVWVLRFAAPAGPVLYRLLVLTRNLTFDRSWDAMLVLDGELVERRNAFSANHPLGDFVAALPDLAVRPLGPEVRARIDQMQWELRRVVFEVPPGFEEIHFWPLGLGRSRSWPFHRRGERPPDRMLVISPFVSPDVLQRLAAQGSGHLLVSRLESLAELGEEDLDPFEQVQVLHEAADPEYEPGANAQDPATKAQHLTTEARDTAAPGQEPSAADGQLSGLHAKVYVADAGWNARLWVGSANATHAAFAGNVKFLVELRGKKRRCGVDAVLGEGQPQGLAKLLKEYEPTGEPEPPDPARAELEALVQEARRILGAAPLSAQVHPGAEPQTHRLELRLEDDLPQLWSERVQVWCRPITLREADAVPLSLAEIQSGGLLAAFDPVSLEALTSFFAFHLTAADGGMEVSAPFVVNLPLQGAPPNRRQQVLARLLKTPDRLLQYLLFLLAGDADRTAGNLALTEEAVTRTAAAAQGNGSDLGAAGVPLLEALVRALHRDPARLDRVAETVALLREDPEGAALLPAGFDEVWAAVWQARQGVKNR